MKILSLDTSATSASVCLFDTEYKKIISEYYINTKLTHSQTLVPMIDSILKSTSTDISEVDLFATNVGPGSFTGIRIGVSVAKGLAMASDKPCAGVSTLESMAYNYIDSNDIIICACMDARRNQVYNAVFLISDNHLTRLCDDRAVSIVDLITELAEYDKHIMLVGDGAELCYNSILENKTNIYVSLAMPSKRYQHAASVAMCADVLNNQGKLLSAAQLMPVYLRPSQAERERIKRESKD